MIAALNKFWRPLTEKEFWNDMDIIMTNNAIEFARFDAEIVKRVFKIKDHSKKSIFEAAGR